MLSDSTTASSKAGAGEEGGGALGVARAGVDAAAASRMSVLSSLPDVGGPRTRDSSRAVTETMAARGMANWEEMHGGTQGHIHPLSTHTHRETPVQVREWDAAGTAC